MDRWTSRDGRLTLCKQHVEPVKANIPVTVWDKRLDYELRQYESLVGWPLACDFCEIDVAATAAEFGA
jgi:hypothetical protein